jgi:FkbM family methyltransferase
MTRRIHVFDNGIRVYDAHLIPEQRKRYEKRNVHEAQEEDLFLEVIRSLPPDGCFLNIGSAIGYYLFLAKNTAPGLSIHAVEPLERFQKAFAENAALNDFAATEFVLHSEGISSSVGVASFVDYGFGSSIVTRRERPSVRTFARAILRRIGLRRGANILKIPTMTLDALITRIGTPVDLCQMDIQGLELAALEGAKRAMEEGTVRTFLIGSHGPELHRKCITLLELSGYAIEFEEQQPPDQPDGIILASKGVRRLRTEPRP